MLELIHYYPLRCISCRMVSPVAHEKCGGTISVQKLALLHTGGSFEPKTRDLLEGRAPHEPHAND